MTWDQINLACLSQEQLDQVNAAIAERLHYLQEDFRVIQHEYSKMAQAGLPDQVESTLQWYLYSN
ncbi:hypothetical protein BKE30_14435 [Alkanindiges hydrocarboniclasticus]|uniref:Uncharacterized protein n=1 Tax=Alkanindiges hydrocarboniclasticus TaxID=1907941 RepID=A0A1S8CQK8_9GAMM|nr:hypothetical protein BKE30_14435 [Alkanindiges hydrocarboniclasticus]